MNKILNNYINEIDELIFNYNILIPMPSKEIQESIVKECDYYDNLINTLKQENDRLQNNNIIDIILKSITNDDLIDELSDNSTNNILTNDQNEINTILSSDPDTDSDNAPSPKPEKKVKKSKKTKSNEI